MSNTLKRGISVPESSIVYGRLWRGAMEVVDGIKPFGKSTENTVERFLTRQTGQNRSYDAIDEKLMEPFSRLAPIEEEILLFAREYGHLDELVTFLQTSPTAINQERMRVGELVSFWMKEVQIFREIYELFGAWRKGDESELKRRIVWGSNRGNTTIIVEYESPSGQRSEIVNSQFIAGQERLQQFEHGDVGGPAIFHVQRTVNKYLMEHTGTHLLWGMEFADTRRKYGSLDPNRHSPALFLMPRNLLGAIWLQFAKVIDSRSSMQRCAICRNLFAVGGGRQKARRSDARCCSDRCRWGQRKRARDLRKQGHSLREIAKILEADQSLVKGWVARGQH